MITLTILLFIVHYFRSRKLKMSTENNYKILKNLGKFEIREYNRTTRASVILRKELKKRINTGFQILFGYIDGKNSHKEKITFISPVIVEMMENSAKMSFVLPKEKKIEKLPSPQHDRIIIEESQSQNYLCYKFDGFATNTKLLARRDELSKFADENQFETSGPFEYHNYNAPYTLFNRHNEIVVPLAYQNSLN